VDRLHLLHLLLLLLLSCLHVLALRLGVLLLCQ
jgi:hypothetical protein